VGHRAPVRRNEVAQHKRARTGARAAGLKAGVRPETRDPATAVGYDRQRWNELASLRFLDAAHGALQLDRSE
jgi:hypothetical protein